MRKGSCRSNGRRVVEKVTVGRSSLGMRREGKGGGGGDGSHGSDGCCAGRGDGRERERLDDELESEGSLMSVDGCWLCFLIR